MPKVSMQKRLIEYAKDFKDYEIVDDTLYCRYCEKPVSTIISCSSGDFLEEIVESDPLGYLLNF